MSAFDRFWKWLGVGEASRSERSSGTAPKPGPPAGLEQLSAPETAKPGPPAGLEQSSAPETAKPAPPAGLEQSSAPETPKAGPPAKKRRNRATRQDDERLESEARALFGRGDAAGAISLLGEKAILFARHEPTTLPCLCKACLVPDVRTAEAVGIEYVRDFVVTRNHVLFYWMPSDLQDSTKSLRSSMRGELRRRLSALQTREDEPREVVNPFTKETVAVQPRSRRRKETNPFTGKRLS